MACMVPGCGKSRYTTKDDIHFHSFPKDPELCEKWRKAIKTSKRETPFTKHSLVCSSHFKPTDYSSSPSMNGLRIKLKPNSVPSILPPREKLKKSQLLKHAARLQAAKAETESSAETGDVTGNSKQKVYIMVPKHKLMSPIGTGFLIPGIKVKVQLPEGGGQLLTVQKKSVSATQTRSEEPSRTEFETVFLNSAVDEESSQVVDLINPCDFKPIIKQEKSDCESEMSDPSNSVTKIKQENQCESEMSDPSNSVANIEQQKYSQPSCSTEGIKQEIEEENGLNFMESPKNVCKLEPICNIDEQDTKFEIQEEPGENNSNGDKKHKHEIYAGLAKTLGQNKFNSKVVSRMEVPKDYRKLSFHCRFCSDMHRPLIRCKSDHIRLLCCRCLSSTNYRTPGALKTHLRNVHHLTKCQVEVNTYILIMQRLPPAKITLRCAFCEQAQSSVKALSTHLKHKHFYCKYCGPVRSAGIDAVEHIDKHYASFRNLFKCSVCKAIYVTKAQMFHHFRTEHEGLEVNFTTLDMDVTKEHSCPYCYFCTDVYEILEFHMFLHTFKCCYNCNEVYMLPAKSVQNSEFKLCTKCDPDLHYPSITELPCLFCDSVLEPGVPLYEHQRVKHNYCGVCKLSFTSLADLTEHESVYHRLVHECLHCPLKFLSGNEIHIHRLKLHPKLKCYGTQEENNAFFISEYRNRFQFEKILTPSHCGYCCEYLPHSFEFEEHFELKHNVKRCTKCLRLVVDVCLTCMQEMEQECPENNCMLVYDT